MKTATYLYREELLDKSHLSPNFSEEKSQLVLGFGNTATLGGSLFYEQIKNRFPNANIALCSTAGEIFGNEVMEDCVSLTAIEFEKTEIQCAELTINNFSSSFDAGVALISQLKKEDLRYVFVLSDGEKVNGSQLVNGINSLVLSNIPVTGGLAGNGVAFKSTRVGLNAPAEEGNVLAIGFYGPSIKIAHGTMAGWENFGMEKTVTHSKDNLLFEIDHKNALDLYKKYLGVYADDLPGSALFFPLSVKQSEDVEPVVRTILGINKENKSMIFAGDVPVGSKVRFMKSNIDQLVDAASIAAQQSIQRDEHQLPKLAILISCVGRKLILGKRVEEEIEAVADVFGNDVALTGFYSYGEISPVFHQGKCELHNQTMTITTFDEL